jgi:hypothetical protein
MISENNLLSFKAQWLTLYRLHECAEDLRFEHKTYLCVLYDHKKK